LTYGLLGYSYAATGQSLSAESAYRNAVLLQPDLLDWKVGMAQTLFKQQKHAEAAALCGELLERYPERTDLWLLQAGAYVGMGQPLKAAENYEILHRMGKGTVASLATLGDIYVNEGLWDLAASAYGAALDADPLQDASRPLRWIAVLAQRGATTQARALASRCKAAYGDRLDGRRSPDRPAGDRRARSPRRRGSPSPGAALHARRRPGAGAVLLRAGREPGAVRGGGEGPPRANPRASIQVQGRHPPSEAGPGAEAARRRGPLSRAGRAPGTNPRLRRTRRFGAACLST